MDSIPEKMREKKIIINEKKSKLMMMSHVSENAKTVSK